MCGDNCDQEDAKVACIQLGLSPSGTMSLSDPYT